jgi:leucine-rich PPR motif-containing protein
MCVLIIYWFYTGKSKETDKALGLWTRMQEEDVQPSDEFLSTLGMFLKKEGKEVPFFIPEVTEVHRDRSESHEAHESGAALTATQKFRLALRRNDIDEALAYKQM